MAAMKVVRKTWTKEQDLWLRMSKIQCYESPDTVKGSINHTTYSEHLNIYVKIKLLERWKVLSCYAGSARKKYMEKAVK